MGTNKWLRMIVYERVPKKYGTLLTFSLSALWHGFYPGYYVTFISGALIVTAARTVCWQFTIDIQSKIPINNDNSRLIAGTKVIPSSVPAQWIFALFLRHFNGDDYSRIHGLSDIPIRFAWIQCQSSFVPDTFCVPSSSRFNHHLHITAIYSRRTKIPTTDFIIETNSRNKWHNWDAHKMWK